jgi:hypothetical protein
MGAGLTFHFRRRDLPKMARRHTAMNTMEAGFTKAFMPAISVIFLYPGPSSPEPPPTIKEGGAM